METGGIIFAFPHLKTNVMSELEIPTKDVDQLQTAPYADGDLDLGVWEEEIEDLHADEIMDPDGTEARKKRDEQGWKTPGE